MNRTIGVPRIIPSSGDKVCDYWIPGNVSRTIEHFLALNSFCGNVAVANNISPQTFVTVNQYPTYRSSHNFDRPNDFIPDRFLSSASSEGFAKDNKAAFQPFGLGRHACIGQSLAYAEMRLILARIFFTFDIELADAADVWDWGSQETFIFWEKKALNVRLSMVSH
jgi:cytochrome P450